MLTVMKTNLLLIACISTAGFVVGCNQDKTTSQQLEVVKMETTQATQDMKDYTYAQKDEFVKAMQAQLTTLNQDLEKLSAKIDNSTDAIKAEAKPKLQALRDQATKLNQQLAEAQNATESTWDTVKAASKKAYASMADGVLDARKWVSDKIAP